MNKIAKYICITIIFLCLILISTSLDVYLNTDSLISIITKICITIICIVIIRKENILKEKNKTTSEDIAVALIPMTFSILLIFGPINKMPNTYVIISGVLGAFTTAVWEELSYRVIGTKAFEDENEKLNRKSVILLCLLFGFSHAINIILKPNEILIELFRIILSTAVGSLFLALYLKTRNIKLSILSHFLLNYVTLFFKTFSTIPNYLGYIAYDVIYYLSVVTYFVISWYIFRRYDLLSKDK